MLTEVVPVVDRIRSKETKRAKIDALLVLLKDRVYQEQQTIRASLLFACNMFAFNMYDSIVKEMEQQLYYNVRMFDPRTEVSLYILSRGYEYRGVPELLLKSNNKHTHWAEQQLKKLYMRY